VDLGARSTLDLDAFLGTGLMPTCPKTLLGSAHYYSCD
jgi:hypothetical protein